MEYRIHLTPDEAATGTTRTIDLPSGPMNVRVPPGLSGRLFKVPTSEGDIVVRVEVDTDSDSAGQDTGPIEAVTPHARPSRRRISGARLSVPLIVIAAGITTAAVREANSHDYRRPAGVQVVLPTDDSDPGLDGTVPDDTYPAYPLPSDLASQPPSRLSTDAPDPFTTSATASTPYAVGTCFYGTPAGLTNVTITMSEPATCSSSDTVFKVVKVLMGTTDPDGCNNIIAAFVYSTTGNGTYADGTAWQAVYCLEAYA